ncbi:MAG: hypothetical protein BGO96_04145 [Micrococcales bacterium 73-15]|uniref:FtsX-like permease family protein n=1 Tax=Salana multivorans TaxID=120377 RepID=UPI0009608DE1|nr:FtsX-like permease family protein [Salana multivorans]OJX98372.1 MAG: hypothetical protein BGO96_04145 [Micrococcales bacterium 73-15]
MAAAGLGWGRLLARHLRLSAARWSVLALVVLATSAAVMIWPRWIERSATDELRQALSASGFVDPTAVPSSLWIDVMRPAPSAETAEAYAWGAVQRTLTQVHDDAPSPLRDVLDDPGMFAVVTGQVQLPVPGGSGITGMSIRGFTAPDVLDRVELVEGRPPAYVPIPSDQVLFPIEGEPGYEEYESPPLEIALSEDAAEALMWPVGESRVVATRYPWTQEIVLTATFRATPESEASGWANQAAQLLHPTTSYSIYQDVFVETRAYVPPGGAMMRLWAADTSSNQPSYVRLWYPFTASTVTMHEAGLLAQQLRDLVEVPVPVEHGSVSFTTSAPDIIDDVAARQLATNAVLGLAVAAPAGVLLVLLALAASVIVQPRRSALGLLTARGASPGQVRALLGAEAALVAVPAAVAGGVLATALVPAHASPWWWAGPAAVAAAPVCSLALGGGGRPRPRVRLVTELAVGLLTLAATVTLLTARRVGTTAVGAASGGTDPLVLVTPLLLAVCVAIVCLHLLPALVRPVAARLRRRDDLVPALGSTLASRRRPPLASTIAVATGAAVAVLGQVATATVTHGLHEAARTSVGADVRITAGLSPDDVAWLEDLDGVAAVATVVSPYSSATFIAADGPTTTFTLYAVDPAALAAVQAEVPGALEVPTHGAGAPADLVLSERAGQPPGTAGELVASRRSPAVVDHLAARAPGLTGSGTWGAVDVAALQEAGIDLPPGSALLSVDSDDRAATAAVVAALREHFGDRATVASYDERVAELAEAPTARALRTGLAIVSWLGIGAAVVAVLLTLAGANEPRTRLVSVLRTLGLPPRAELRLVLWEIAPAVGLALVLGAGLGVGLGALLVRVTDLRPFTGTVEQPSIALEPLGLTLTLAGAVLAVVVSVVVAAWSSGRRSAAVILRVGEGSS